MLIMAKNAKPGVIYQTRNGQVEIACSPRLRVTGKPKVWFAEDGQVYAYVVKDGKRIGGHIRIPAFYRLEDGREISEASGVEKRKRGRQPRTDNLPWRGLALSHHEQFGQLLGKISDLGFDIEPTAHYFRIVADGKTFCALWRSGNLGFSASPGHELEKFPAEVANEKSASSHRDYLPYRIVLPLVVVGGDWESFLKEFLAYLSGVRKRQAAERHKTQVAFWKSLEAKP